MDQTHSWSLGQFCFYMFDTVRQGSNQSAIYVSIAAVNVLNMEELWDHSHRWGSQEAIETFTETEMSLSAHANQVLRATLPPVGSLKNWLSKVGRKGQTEIDYVQTLIQMPLNTYTSHHVERS